MSGKEQTASAESPVDESAGDDAYDGPEPEDYADPTCGDCDGEGGWTIYRGGRHEWTACGCIDWQAYSAAVRQYVASGR